MRTRRVEVLSRPKLRDKDGGNTGEEKIPEGLQVALLFYLAVVDFFFCSFFSSIM
jgi:hypothetical protein